MKIAFITANLGNFEKFPLHVPQSIHCDYFRITDDDFPPRYNSMTPRLQARIPKMFGWQMFPRYDIYLWVDSSCILSHPDSIKWFLGHLGDKEMAVFKHPNRSSIKAEAEYLKHRLAIKCPYITPRYENELIDEQLAEIKENFNFVDNKLFASTAFIYRPTDRVKRMMKEWWYFTSRYHSIDQLSLPYVLADNGVNFNIIPDKYTSIPYLKYIRNEK